MILAIRILILLPLLIWIALSAIGVLMLSHSDANFFLHHVTYVLILSLSASVIQIISLVLFKRPESPQYVITSVLAFLLLFPYLLFYGGGI